MRRQPVPAANQIITPRPAVPNHNVNPLDHQKLVTTVVKKYVWACRGKNLDFDDLFQVGMMGVVRACETFDEAHGYKFSTYATHWIRHYIRRLTCDQARTVRFPIWVQEKARRDGKAIPVVTMSLDAPMKTSEGDGDSQLDMEPHPDPQLDSNEGPICIQQRKKFAQYLLSTLTDKERHVLTMRMKDATLEVVGNSLGVTRERARQIEAIALSKLERKVTQSERQEYALP
jgi:RNA polymerase primary sigma factor